jgi:DNA-binding response OmpR family regulator
VSKEKLSILIVEDNGMFLNVAEEMLAEHNVITATTAKDGLNNYIQHKPDITLLDIALPDGSGHDVLCGIRKINPEAYVIMLTGSRLREDVIKSMNEGAEGYIMKPFSNDMIRECVKEFYEYQSKKAK